MHLWISIFMNNFYSFVHSLIQSARCQEWIIKSLYSRDLLANWENKYINKYVLWVNKIKVISRYNKEIVGVDRQFYMWIIVNWSLIFLKKGNTFCVFCCGNKTVLSQGLFQNHSWQRSWMMSRMNLSKDKFRSFSCAFL